MSEDDFTLCTARSKHLKYEKSRCCKILQLSSERYKGCVGEILHITPASLPLPPPPEGLDAGRNMKQLCAIDQYPVYQNSDQLALCFLTSNIKRQGKEVCQSNTNWLGEQMVYIIQVKNLRYLTYVNKKACSAVVLQTVGEGSLHNGQWQQHDFCGRSTWELFQSAWC